MKYLFPKREIGKTICYVTYVTFGYKHSLYSTVKNWVARFSRGHLSTNAEEISGRPNQVTFPENVDAILSMILNDRTSTKIIAETVAMYPERVGGIIR
jgi:transposase